MVENYNYNLPSSWSITKLGDVCETTSGGTPSRKRLDYYQGNIPWLKSGELNYNVIFNAEESINEDAIKNSSAKLFPKGTLLVALYGATVGKLGILGIEATTNQAICGIFESKTVDTKFLYYLFFFKRPTLLEERIGGAQPNISQLVIRNLSLVIPPLPEQYRIVSKLEELFTQLDVAVYELKRAKIQIKTYKQSVLKSAFDGRLLGNNKAINEETGLPEGWNFTILEDAVKNLQYGTSDKANENPDGIPVLRMGNIQDGLLDYSKLKYFDKSYADINKYLLKEGDVLFNRTNSAELVGKTAVYKKHHPQSVFASYLIKIQVDEKKLNPEYLAYFINSIFGREFIKTVVSQNVGQANVNGTKLKSMVLPLPDIQEQNDIVTEIETRFSEAENLEKTIDLSLLQAESLRQSILKKAFEGRLVPQDPNDEPASVLLEKIKKEKSNNSIKVKK